jgi:hypothetical protein
MKTCKARKAVISGIVIGSLLTPAMAVFGQVSSLFVQEYPQNYIVQEDDTINDIASIFLVDPGNWDSVWLPSPGRGSDDIDAGDIIEVDFIDGSPKIVSKRGDMQVERLSPQMREIAMLGSIPEIPLESISSSFTNNRIVTEAEYEDSLFILSPTNTNIAIGANDEMFARGEWPAGIDSFEIYRRINAFDASDSDDETDIELETVGTARIVDDGEGDIKRMLITNSKREILVGDRLMIREDVRMDSIIYPTEPDQEVEGHIVAMTNTERMASQLDTVLINLGSNDSLKVGSILELHQPGPQVVDKSAIEEKSFFGRLGASVRAEKIEMPSRNIGTLMIYRVFDRMSYGLILSSTEPSKTGDKVVSP